jgi:hypothetical protein
VLALGVDCFVLALGVDCRFPEGPVGLNCELPDDGRAVVEVGRLDGDADRCEAAVERFAPDALDPEP